MKYVVCTYSCGYCGCDEERAVAFSDDITEAEIDKYFLDGVVEYASDTESVIGSKEDYESEEEYNTAIEDFYVDCTYDWHYEDPTDENFSDYDWEEA